MVVDDDMWLVLVSVMYMNVWMRLIGSGSGSRSRGQLYLNVLVVHIWMFAFVVFYGFLRGCRDLHKVINQDVSSMRWT